MLQTPDILESARQNGGEDLCQKLQDDYSFRRLHMHNLFLLYMGKPLGEWCESLQERSQSKKTTVPNVSVPTVKKFPFSDQKAAFNNWISDLFNMLSLNSMWQTICWYYQNRLDASRLHFREGTTPTQRYCGALFILLFELLMPLVWLLAFISALLIRVILQTGIKFPLLSVIYFVVSKSGMNGSEALPPGENGYTKVFQGGDDVDLDELERELMKRNDQQHYSHVQNRHVNTICISYKHYTNKGNVAGDDHRICRVDLRAIALLIREAAACKIRFWIDAKLPRTTDDSFERWINRGVRPYGRYITLICPSAQQYAQSSFWLSNEYHFAVAAKGAMYLEHNKIYYHLRYGSQLEVHRRFLHVLIGAERQPVQVRDKDKGKVIHWAMCCLRTETRVMQGMSPSIDNLATIKRLPHQLMLLNNMTKVIAEFGPQPLPIVPGRSWNKNNPLLMDDIPDRQCDLSNWYGLCLDEAPATIYFLHELSNVHLHYDTVFVVEVLLEKPHFAPGKIRVIGKVLRELSSSVVAQCKFVALPWLCDWE